MRTYRAEFHVHTVLSPCAEVEMIPPLIVDDALERGIDILAITDHNATGNIAAVQKAARGTSLSVLPGMELQTREEVHLLCIFESLDQIREWQEYVNELLPDINNDPDHFGGQFIVDETGDFVGNEERLLLVSANIGLEEAIAEVNRRDGIAIPAHVDRKANGLFPLLGFIPNGLAVAALEVSRHFFQTIHDDLDRQMINYPVIQNGDAHRLDEFLGVNQLSMLAPSLKEIRLALSKQEDRTFKIIHSSL